MKILLVSEEYPPFKGGVAHYYYNLALNFPYSDDLIVLNNNKLEINSKNNLPFPWFKSIGAILKNIKKNKIDFIFAGQILPYGTAIYLVSLFKKVPYGVFLHGMDFSFAIRKKRKKILTRIILKRAEIIVAANSFVAEEIKSNFPKFEDKIIIVNPGLPEINTDPCPQNRELLDKKFDLDGKTILFTLARLVKRKGIDMTLKALAKMSEEEKKDLVYFIAGCGSDELYLRSLVSGEDKKRVFFLGQISDDEKWSWLNKCDIFIMPSRNIAGDYEGFGIVYLEANLCLKPVIAGNAGGVGDAVLNGKNGLIVDPEDEEDIKEAILRLKNNPNLREKMGYFGKNRVIKDFSWENQAKDLVEFIKMKI